MLHEQQTTHLEWRRGMAFDATTTTGHHLVLDAPPPGGSDLGPKPVELLLTALAGCTAMDVLSILQKNQEPVLGLTVDLRGTRAGTHQMVYTEIEVTYRVRGDVDSTAVERAIELSEDKYCSVYAMLEYSAHITSRYEIEPKQIIESGVASGHDPAAEAGVVFGPDHSVELEHVAVSLP